MYDGYFISMRSSEDRRRALSQHLEQIGAAARYRHFEAVDGQAVIRQYSTPLSAGALGCWLSHLTILHANRGRGRHLHIIEDDALLVPDAVGVTEQLLRHADQALGTWDLIWTDMLVQPENQLLAAFMERITHYQRGGGYTLLDANSVYIGGSSSYLVNRGSIGKVTDLLEGQWTVGLPMDLYVRDLLRNGRLNSYAVLPFLATVSHHGDTSTIVEGKHKSKAVYSLYRRAFFRDADVPALRAELDDLMRDARIPPLATLHLQVLGFIASDQFVQF